MSMEKYVKFATQSFTFPKVCVKIREVLDDHRSDMQDVGELIAVDPSLTAKMLRLANSALFRFPSQIESITKAVNVIGGEALYNLVVAETANSAFKHFHCDHLNLKQHWHLSVYNGMLAKYLAKYEDLRDSERFFVMGILTHFAELVIAKKDPARYLKYKTDNREALPWEKQQEHFGFTFAACSGEIMARWQLPSALCNPVKSVHDCNKQAEDRDISLLACSMRVTIRENLADNYGDIDFLTPSIGSQIVFQGETLGNAVAFADEETDKVSAIIL